MNTDSDKSTNLDEIYYKPAHKSKLRYVRYFFEAVGVFIFYGIFWLLPLDTASAIGGKVFRKIAPLTKKHKVALMNLELAFPEKTPEERQKIALDEWENIGRTLCEYPHIYKNNKLKDRITFENPEYAKEFLNEQNGGFLLSMHYGNWELTSLVVQIYNKKANFVYRKPNNPFVLKIFQEREKKIGGNLIGKDENSLMKIMKCISRKELVGMLIDQKLNEGVPVKFFGTDAMTTPAPAIVAKRYGCPILLAKVERVNMSANFKVTCHKPLMFKKGKADMKTITEITQEISNITEQWIRENPSQWLWIHKRWTQDAIAAEMEKRKNYK